MPPNSQRKGKEFERVVAKRLGGRRTPGSGSMDIKGDVRNLSGPFADFVIECKHQESGSLWAFVRQAVAEVAGAAKSWVVVWKRNHCEPVAVMDFNEWACLVERIGELEDQLRQTRADLEGSAEG